MIAGAAGSWSAAILRALAGRGGSRGDTPSWTLSGSAATCVAAPFAAAVRGPLDSLARVADHAGARLSARPAVLVAVAILAIPILRLAAPPAAAGPAALVLAAVAGTAVLLAAAAALHGPAEEGRWVARALLAGLALRLAFAAAAAGLGGFPDERMYHRLAADAEACWRSGGPSTLAEHPVAAGRALYLYLLSGTYLVLGPDMAAGRLLGILVGLGGALLAGEVARALGGARAAAWAVALVALHPEHAFWNATLSRDGLATLSVLLALAILLRRPGTLLRGNLLLAAVPVGLLAMNNFLAAGALAAALALMVLAEAFAAPAGPAVRALRIGGAVLLAGAALVWVGARYGNLFTPELFSAVRTRAIGTEADFFPHLRFTGMAHVLAFLPLGVLFVLGAPFPWEAVHAHRAAYGVLAVAGLVVALAGIFGLAGAARRRPAAAAPVLLFGLLYLGLLAVLEGTSGIVVRHRLPLTALLAVGAALLLAARREAPAR